MPYKPTFPSPYMQAISASKDGGNVFRCLINPRDSVYGYELTISSVENELKEAGETTETETETHTISRTVDGTTKSVDGSDVALEVGDSELPVIGSSAEDSWLAVVVPKGLLTDGRSYTWRIKLFGSKVDAGQQNIVVATNVTGVYHENDYVKIKYSNKSSNNPAYFSYSQYRDRRLETYDNEDHDPADSYRNNSGEKITWDSLTQKQKNEIIQTSNESISFRSAEGVLGTIPQMRYLIGDFYKNTFDGFTYALSLLNADNDYFYVSKNDYKNNIIPKNGSQGTYESMILSPQRAFSTSNHFPNYIGYSFGLFLPPATVKVSNEYEYGYLIADEPSTSQYIAISSSDEKKVEPGMYVFHIVDGEKIYSQIIEKIQTYDGAWIHIQTPISDFKNKDNVSFSVVSNYVESADFYFNTRTEPNVSITVKNLTSPDGDTVTLSSSILEATGSYTQQQSIPIESYVFNLYSSDGELIDTSGDIISSKITYTYKGLMTNRDYTLELAVTNEDGVVTKVEKEILCSYSDGDSDISTWAYFVTDKNDYTETSAYNAGTVCVVISNESITTPYFCDVIRRDVKTDEIKIIATDVAVDGDDTIMISDYTAQSGRAYRYMVTPFNDKRTAFISAETGEVTSNLAGVMLYDLTPTADKKVFNVTKNSVYLFDTDLQFGELKLNNTKNYTETYSAYPHEAYTKNNHLVGSVEALLGTYNCGKDYVGDGIDRMDDFKKLAVNGHLKLIKDRMGNCIIGDIEDVSYSYVRENGKDMTKLSFNFTELADSKSITVYAEG